MSSVGFMQSSPDAGSVYMEAAVSVAKKAKNVNEAQGQAVLHLIDSAAAVSNVSGANAAARGTGVLLDVLA